MSVVSAVAVQVYNMLTVLEISSANMSNVCPHFQEQAFDCPWSL